MLVSPGRPVLLLYDPWPATLGDVYTRETSDMENYQSLPFHYIEVATLILEQ